MGGMTRDEHLAMAKRHALAYVEEGDLLQAVTSMGSDLSKHPDFRGETYAMLVVYALWFEIPKGPEAVRRWIEGFR